MTPLPMVFRCLHQTYVLFERRGGGGGGCKSLKLNQIQLFLLMFRSLLAWFCVNIEIIKLQSDDRKNKVFNKVCGTPGGARHELSRK